MLLNDPDVFHALTLRWTQEDKSLGCASHRILQWINSHRRFTKRNQSELTSRLLGYRVRLRQHFVDENSINSQFCQEFPPGSESVVSICQESCEDQVFLLDMLDAIIETAGRCTMPDWAHILRELELFFDTVKEHGVFEARSIERLSSRRRRVRRDKNQIHPRR